MIALQWRSRIYWNHALDKEERAIIHSRVMTQWNKGLGCTGIVVVADALRYILARHRVDSSIKNKSIRRSTS